MMMRKKEEEEEEEEKRCRHQGSKFNLCKKIVETWPDISECLLTPSLIPEASSRDWVSHARFIPVLWVFLPKLETCGHHVRTSNGLPVSWGGH